MQEVGRKGETIEFDALPRDLQTAGIASHFGATLTGAMEDDGFEACGSPGETSNDPQGGFLQPMTISDEDNIQQYQQLD